MDKWLERLEKDFSDCEVYFGINPKTHQTVIDKILKSNLKSVVAFVKDENYCESDASGTQVALQALKAQGGRHDYYWFIHTKGGVNQRQERFQYYLDEFLGKREETEAFLQRNPYIGSYGHYGVGQSADGVTQWKTLSHLEFDHGNIPIVQNINFEKLTCTHVNWSYVETFYIIKGELINWMVDKADDTYFGKRIRNRWYGEVVLPWLASRAGLYPYVKYGLSQFAQVDLNLTTKEWEKENNLQFNIVP